MPPLRITRRRFLTGALITSAVLGGGLAACAVSRPQDAPPAVQPLGQATFADYARDTRRWVESRRRFATADHAAEAAWNSPSELLPADGLPPRRGILLVHGLGDSPWSFVDQGAAFARAGWLVRTVLLPGCGTRPEDMIPASADDWRRVVGEQAEILRRDLAAASPGAVPEVWLGGFSTGCNLSIEFASEHDWIAGLVLFSPAVAVRSRLAFLAPIAAPFTNWLREPEDSRMGGVAPVRYTVVPVPALAAFVDTMRGAERALERRPFTRPAVIMMSEHDRVVDTQTLLPFFTKRFTSPRTRFLWYGTSPVPVTDDPRIIARTDALPQEGVASLSHRGLIFAPGNPQFGRAGSSRRAFNPWFEAQERDILAVMAGPNA
ncbi:alpha/beta fold hydrolase [uncultured Sutterella sp.]|uniref:alpha/beta hydrolase n=1 Tax=uncultured Sutterella sp. TaxID=286133 RepID=UPI0025CF8067|nr:alpha/beta fold hydrolase [uncultured Sutterella sp.]